MNVYEKFLATLTPEKRSVLAMHQCMWCSQLGTATKCGIPAYCDEPKCAPEKRVEQAKRLLISSAV